MSSGSQSDSDMDDDGLGSPPASYHVKLNDIKTIHTLYQTGVLKATLNTQYLPNPSLLERISLLQGDITRLDVDAIVNAANRSLLGLRGRRYEDARSPRSVDHDPQLPEVDGAIHAAAGRKLLEECRSLNGCLTGESKITRGYNLPARYIIHTVGPIYAVREKAEKAAQLASSYKTSLELAAEKEIRHIAFPSISTGIYSYPIVDATRIALNTTRVFLDSEQGGKLERVIFVVWSDKDKEVYERMIPEYFPPDERSESAETATTVAVEGEASGTTEN